MSNFLDIIANLSMSITTILLAWAFWFGYSTSRKSDDRRMFAVLVGILTPFAIALELLKRPIRWIAQAKQRNATKSQIRS